jgi:hypothetical protein
MIKVKGAKHETMEDMAVNAQNCSTTNELPKGIANLQVLYIAATLNVLI